MRILLNPIKLNLRILFNSKCKWVSCLCLVPLNLRVPILCYPGVMNPWVVPFICYPVLLIRLPIRRYLFPILWNRRQIPIVLYITGCCMIILFSAWDLNHLLPIIADLQKRYERFMGYLTTKWSSKFVNGISAVYPCIDIRFSKILMAYTRGHDNFFSPIWT